MRISEGLDGLRRLAPGAVLSVGNYDGVHLGHLLLLGAARALRATAGASGGVAVATFEPHPLSVLRPELAPPRLTPPPVKRELLAAAGVDELVVLPPTPDVLNLSAEAFWALLRDESRPSHLVEGGSFTFGKNRGGTIDRLRAWAAGTDVRLTIVDPVSVTLTDYSVVPVNSSTIRWLLAHGRARDAAAQLGRPYALRGEVVKGFQRGRTIGVPTANLRVDDQLVPADGVYAGRCSVDGATYPAAVSLGTLPTFAERAYQIEAHLIGFAGDLYGRVLTVELLDWVREQWKFDGVDALKAQLVRDVAWVEEVANSDAGRASLPAR